MLEEKHVFMIFRYQRPSESFFDPTVNFNKKNYLLPQLVLLQLLLLQLLLLQLRVLLKLL